TATITVTNPIGATYEYSIDGTNWVSSPVFANLAADATYTISVRNTATDPTCVASAPFVVNTVPLAPVTPVANLTQPTCAVNTATITVTNPIGATYEYSIDGTNWVSSPVFANLAADATYTISVRNTATDPTCVASTPFAVDTIPLTPMTPMPNL